MPKDRTSALIVAIALLATLATPALATDSGAAGPAGTIERVTAFVEGFIETVQDALCFGSCGTEAVATATAKASQQAPDDAIATRESGTPARIMVGADALGHR